jgi:hypothetical protein
MKIFITFIVIYLFAFNAHAGYVCLPGYDYSQNYVSKTWCDTDLNFDLVKGKAYELSCTKGLIYYFYCKKKN